MRGQNTSFSDQPRLLNESPGSAGRSLSRDDLPSPNTKRWVTRRKAEVVAGVRAGLITLEEACERYSLSLDEFASWQRLFDSHGLAGLRTTRTQSYRPELGAPSSPSFA